MVSPLTAMQDVYDTTNGNDPNDAAVMDSDTSKGLSSLLRQSAKGMMPDRMDVNQRRDTLLNGFNKLIQAQQFQAPKQRDPGLAEFGLQMMAGDGTESFANTFARASKARNTTDADLRKQMQEAAIAQASTGLKRDDTSLDFLDKDQANALALMTQAGNIDARQLQAEALRLRTMKPRYLKQPDGSYIAVGGDGSIVPVPGTGPKPAKPLSAPMMKDLEKKAEGYEQMKRLNNSFDKSFAGDYSDMIGELKNYAGRKLGDDTGRSQWWQDYQDYTNKVRNDLFGAALTETEKGEFLKQMVTPGMNPEQAKQNLKRQHELTEKAIKRTTSVLAKGNYSADQISEYYTPEGGSTDTGDTPPATDTTPAGLPSTTPEMPPAMLEALKRKGLAK